MRIFETAAAFARIKAAKERGARVYPLSPRGVEGSEQRLDDENFLAGNSRLLNLGILARFHGVLHVPPSYADVLVVD